MGYKAARRPKAPPMRTEEPRAIHLADYQAPEFRIRTVHLDFVLEPEATKVTTRLEIERLTGDGPLELSAAEFGRTRALLWLQVALFIFIPLCAAFMARGFH